MKSHARIRIFQMAGLDSRRNSSEPRLRNTHVRSVQFEASFLRSFEMWHTRKTRALRPLVSRTRATPRNRYAITSYLIFVSGDRDKTCQRVRIRVQLKAVSATVGSTSRNVHLRGFRYFSTTSGSRGRQIADSYCKR